MNDKNMYDEFIINFNSRLNRENYPRNALNRNNTQYMKKDNNNIYNNRTINTNNNNYRERIQPSYKPYNIPNSKLNYIYKLHKENIEYYIIPYHKRIINNHAFKDNKENGMTSINFYNKNDILFRNNIEDDSISNRRNKKNYSNTFDNYNNINYNLINDDYNNNYNYNNNNNGKEEYRDYLITNTYDIAPKNELLDKESEERISNFLEHIIQYCLLYYIKVIQRIFEFLKSQKDMPKNKNKNFEEINNHNNNINIKNKKINMKHYHTYQNILNKTESSKNKYKKRLDVIERIPYRKNTNIIIERIKDNNQSISPSNKNKVEMYRNMDELNKKYEIINNRKNRMSYSNTRSSLNNISFSSENRTIYRSSVENNKEIWENNLNKERERKKKILERMKKKKEDLLIKEKENNLKNKNNKINKNKGEIKTNKDISELKKNCEDLKKKNKINRRKKI